MKEHFSLLKEDKSEKSALLEIRSNILYYLAGLPHAKKVKQRVCEAKNESEIMSVLDEYVDLLKK